MTVRSFSVLSMFSDLWHAIPEPARDPTVLAIPFFVLLLVLEVVTALLDDDEAPPPNPDGRERPKIGGYRTRDAASSIFQGLVSIATTAGWHALFLGVYVALFTWVAPWRLPPDRWWAFVVVFVLTDFVFYWTHRISHRVRLVWATHQAHHSSEYFNFATALRQKWNPTMGLLLWLPLPALGVPPALLYLTLSLNLVYQFVVHTERVDKLWRPIELVMNTPSHHRVHHGSDPEYLDRNYAGVFIVWDRLFGTFQPELHRPTYGLTTPFASFNPVVAQTHEYIAIVRDWRRAATLREKLGYVFGPPGWRPEAVRAPDAAAWAAHDAV